MKTFHYASIKMLSSFTARQADSYLSYKALTVERGNVKWFASVSPAENKDPTL